jgi:hypothetical protein
MGTHGLVLAAVLVTVLVSAALAGALAVFAGHMAPQAVHRELATATGMSVLISGPLTEIAAMNQPTAIPGIATRAHGARLALRLLPPYQGASEEACRRFESGLRLLAGLDR